MNFYKKKCIYCDAMALAEENDDKSYDYNFICVGVNRHGFSLNKASYPKEDFEEISKLDFLKLKK